MSRIGKKNAQIVTVGRRFETGCIATLTDGARTWSEHFVGKDADATRAVAEYCDLVGARIVCLSTPATICRDLQGWRRPDKATNRMRVASLEHVDDGLRLPELRMLAAIGRLDLLVR